MGFCLVIIFFCSGSHSKGWMSKVLNCIKEKRIEWALWRWHKSRGESPINVNAFCVTSTSLIRPHLLLSTKSVNRFLSSLIPWTYLLPMITLKGFFCPWDVSSRVAHPDLSPPRIVLFSLSFLRPCLDQQRSRAVLEVLGDIFDGELLVNLPCALKGEEMQFGMLLFFFLPVIHIHLQQTHRAHLQHWEQSGSQDMYAYFPAILPAESSYCGYLITPPDLTKQ